MRIEEVMKTKLVILAALLTFGCSFAAPQVDFPLGHDETTGTIVKGTLSTNDTTHSSTRHSHLNEEYFCNNHRLELHLIQRFDSKVRVSVDIDIVYNGEKLDKNTVRNATNGLQDYDYFQTSFGCVNNLFGLSVLGYKKGETLKGPAPKVFSLYIDQETGKLPEE
jgi:hypothetical protein